MRLTGSLGLNIPGRKPGASQRRRRRRRRVFKYENMWQRHDAYMDFVQQYWDPGPERASLNSMAETLSSLKVSLTEWNKNIFGSVKRKI
jgi:hypothetical protein